MEPTPPMSTELTSAPSMTMPDGANATGVGVMELRLVNLGGGGLRMDVAVVVKGYNFFDPGAAAEAVESKITCCLSTSDIGSISRGDVD